MSMSLHCAEVALPADTPTVATYCIYYRTYDPSRPGWGKSTDSGWGKPADWRTICNKYLLWYRDLLFGGSGCPSDEVAEREEMYATVEEQLLSHKRLHFSIL